MSGWESPVGGWEETYLRVALLDLAPFAAVQQVTSRGELLGDRLWVEEASPAGMFDRPLLPRFGKLVAMSAGPWAAGGRPPPGAPSSQVPIPDRRRACIE
jgi:hypothetical protein